jgi:chorismate lyase/3-hydroxybenzoate synthase
VAILLDLEGRRPQALRLDAAGLACGVSLRDAGEYSLASAYLPGADGLSAAALQSATADMYAAVRAALESTGAPHPVRMWNFIPAINDPIAEGQLDLYRAFNLGRFEAFERWFGDPAAFARVLPTATGVGHRGHDLVVHALGAVTAGEPLENPRQRPAFRYSRRYGPRPPCFARATRTRLRGRDVLLIGGTASVRGEDSVHQGTLAGQVEESIENLRSLILAATQGPEPLRRITEARVYHVRPEDAASLRSAIAAHLPAVRTLEMVRADICREELLVEIEAVADLSPRGVER